MGQRSGITLSLASPKRGAGAGVGIRMLRGGGLPLIENKIIMFKCLQLKINTYRLLKFLYLKLSNFNFMPFWKIRIPNYQIPISCFSKILIPCYEIPISCFWIDINLVFNMFKNILDRSSGLFGTHLFGNARMFRFPKCYISKHIFKNKLRSPRITWRNFGVPQIKYNWFWESWSRSLGPKTMKIKGLGVVLK